MMAKVKGFISENKVFLIALPFIIMWATFVTSATYTNRSEVREAKQLVESNNRVVQETVKGDNKATQEKITGICSDIEDIKGDIKALKQSLVTHEKDNVEWQRRVYELLLNIDKQVKRHP